MEAQAQPAPSKLKSKPSNAPPMSMIVFSKESVDDSAPSNNKRSSEDSFSMPSAFSTPFRLQPRRPMMSGPSSKRGSGGAGRGRKRTAQSISISAASSPALVSAFGSTPKSLSASVAGEEETSTSMPFSVREISQQDSVVVSTPQNFPTTPLKVENTLRTLQTLSIKSPAKGIISSPSPISSSFDVNQAKRLPTVSTTCGSVSEFGGCEQSSNVKLSSFTIYNGSPAESLRSGAGSIGVARTPSSTKSSPKIAPLTVLTKSGTDNKKTPQRRPPLHGGVSSMLFSLDSQSRSDGGENNKQRRGDSEFFTSPRLPPSTVHCRQSSDSMSSVQLQDFDCLSPPNPTDVSYKRCVPSSKHSRADSLASPSKRSRSGASPRTPLPRVTLTPRSTRSANSRHSSGLPNFPSPSDAEFNADMCCSPPFINVRCKSNAEEGNKRKESFPALEIGDKKAGSFPVLMDRPATKRSLLPNLAPGVSKRSLQPRRPEGGNMSLHSNKANNCGKAARDNDVTMQATVNVAEHSTFKPHHSISQQPSEKVVDSCGDFFLGIKTTSLLTPSRSRDHLQSLLECNGKSAGANGSVSDIDDDESFVLTSPKTLEEERISKLQRSRQRRRRSSENTNTNTLCASLSSSHQASNNSLVGMNIAHPQDSKALSAFPDASAINLVVPGGCMASTFASQSSAGHVAGRRKSEGSFTSIGLSLEASGDDPADPGKVDTKACGERDLVTPPPLPSAPSSPPLAPMNGSDSVERKPANVCIAGADRRSVTLAIAQMAFNAQHEHSPTVEPSAA